MKWFALKNSIDAAKYEVHDTAIYSRVVKLVKPNLTQHYLF